MNRDRGHSPRRRWGSTAPGNGGSAQEACKEHVRGFSEATGGRINKAIVSLAIDGTIETEYFVMLARINFTFFRNAFRNV